MNKFLLVAVLLFSLPSFAEVVEFRCVTKRPFEKGLVRRISFRLDIVSVNKVGIVGEPGHQFSVRPRSDALRALYTYDNGGIYVANKERIQIGADEIGMYNTQIVLWTRSHYRTGYVQTSGESNVRMYSPIVCELN